MEMYEQETPNGARILPVSAVFERQVHKIQTMMPSQTTLTLDRTPSTEKTSSYEYL